MKKIIGIFRGFPGLGRVVSGVSLLETLKEQYECEIKIISYLQGNRYLESKGYTNLNEADAMDYCSIGLLPTNKMGAYIHQTIKEFKPDVIIVDGEPLLIHSIKISHSHVKIVALLTPADIDNPSNDKEAMGYFNNLYSMADMAIIHGLRAVCPPTLYKKYVSIGTIVRKELLNVINRPQKNIYCLLGGGTVNVGYQFTQSTIRIGELCLTVAHSLPNYKIHIVCSSQNIYDILNKNALSSNVYLYNQILDASKYYSNACLIITRSGRNTLSELAFLGIPAISFVSGCTYRRAEQIQNINSLPTTNIVSTPIDISLCEFKELCLRTITFHHNKGHFECGNYIAIAEILSLF